MPQVDQTVFEQLLADRSEIAGRLLRKIDCTSYAELEVYRWCLLYSKAICELAAVPGSMIVRYEDLCSNPLTGARQILSNFDLPWHSQVEQFIRSSTSHASTRYFGLYRQRQQLDSWKDRVPKTVQNRVQELIQETPAGRLYSGPD